MTTKQKEKNIVPDEAVMDKIYYIREQKVMLDRDLADLYGVETKRLKEAVRRNKARFPKDFMFQMNKKELENWRTQFASSNNDRQGLRYAPFCFTEQGVTMLSCVLNSERAIAVNIRIIRIFTRMREMMLTHKDILLKLEQLETKTSRQDGEIKKIFEYLKKLLNPPKEPRVLIGFNRKDEKQNSSAS
ncbi:ORF6N domain-containing protein [Chitinophaga niabensis]|uniref:ORF6N domain-containing protein n=1 Tax=Chitinophaga niabensis TaxID=536979 RepID=A0A1N6K8G5_9BACT|nr:ORF6N domain-containing protein [Chitinophaga niabensis]SIO52884.1 ORF6N domain-containing protein [Chitinophaga niabensis]